MCEVPPPLVIGLCGRARVGKSTASLVLQETHGVPAFAFATALKRVVAVVFAPPGHETITEDMKGAISPVAGVSYGVLLQMVGELFRARFGADFWIKLMFSRIPPDVTRFVVEDVRYPNEGEAVHRRGGYVLKIVRPGAKLDDGRDPRLEDSVDAVKCDGVIENVGSLEEFQEKIRTHYFPIAPN